jgi:hypothetical protein
VLRMSLIDAIVCYFMVFTKSAVGGAASTHRR